MPDNAKATEDEYKRHFNGGPCSADCYWCDIGYRTKSLEPVSR